MSPSFIKSYGITCFTKYENENELRVLLVKRKYTYSFFAFVMNQYRMTRSSLLSLFHQMSIDEKKKILEWDYDVLWNTLWSERNGMSSLSYIKHKKEYHGILSHHKEFIRECLFQSVSDPNRVILWSIPRGRKNHPSEKSLFVSIREFQEETGIDKSRYHLLFDFKRTYVTDTIYKTVFFIGLYKNHMPIGMDLRNAQQALEIQGLQWMSLREISIHCPYLKEMLLPAFRYVRKRGLLM